ncbi:MAG: HK97 family phage prohead protease [Asticcacaulis sp.]
MKTKNSALVHQKTKNAGIQLDVKALGDNGEIEGYASIWDEVDSYGEAVVRGAFKASLAASKRDGRRIKMLYQHDTHKPIGIWDDIQEDGKGLRVKGRILKDETVLGAETFALIKAGALDELSIGYREVETKKDPSRPGVLLLKQLNLKEISIVTFGALGHAAHIDSVKSILEGGDLPSVREFEVFLRDSGFSKSLATAIAGKAAPHLRGEPEAKADDAFAFLTALRG